MGDAWEWLAVGLQMACRWLVNGSGWPRPPILQSSFCVLPSMSALARTFALPNTHQSNISIWNGSSSGSDLSSPGTSLEVPWYHPSTILVP